MVSRRPWTRSELLVVLRLYFTTNFGMLHRRNPDVVEAARRVERTPSAVAMKAGNFASLDPEVRRTGRKGLRGASQTDKQIWEEYQANWSELAAEAESAWEEGRHSERSQEEISHPGGPTESRELVKVRRVQSFFRAAVLANYEDRCAISGLPTPELLNASHIIPWRVEESLRADPTNGIALSAIHDRTFDRGFISLDENLKVIVSSKLKSAEANSFLTTSLLEIEGSKLRLPLRYPPAQRSLEYHRDVVFVN